MRIQINSPKELELSGEIVVDESYFGAKRIREKEGEARVEKR